MRNRRAIPLPLRSLVLSLSCLALLAAAATAQKQDSPAALLDRAQARLDAGDPDSALPLIEQALRRPALRGRALYLRSTARFMLGEHESAVTDLEQAVAADPSLRQAWLNLAAAMMAVERWDRAYEALVQARDLDPAAIDNDLNLGAVELLRGNRDNARAHFERYLAANPADAAAPYQLAANYAVAGDAATAIGYLRQATARDERVRLEIRADPRFDYYHLADFQRLLETDTYVPPPSALTASAAFADPYDSADRLLIDAVLEALAASRLRHDPTVEVTPNWALIWGDVRIKMSNQGDGTGIVSISAPAARYAAASFERLTQQLFRAINDRLTVLRFRRGDR